MLAVSGHGHWLVNADLAIIDKRRPEAGVSEVMNIIGEVDGRHCVMVEDIVDSGKTWQRAVLMEAGALSVDAYVTHWVFVWRCRFTHCVKPAIIASHNRFNTGHRSDARSEKYPANFNRPAVG